MRESCRLPHLPKTIRKSPPPPASSPSPSPSPAVSLSRGSSSSSPPPPLMDFYQARNPPPPPDHYQAILQSINSMVSQMALLARDSQDMNSKLAHLQGPHQPSPHTHSHPPQPLHQVPPQQSYRQALLPLPLR